MTFFNKKEEVIDIQLTQYGKNRLSLGKLNPTYYEFYDDDILYDTEYAGFSENQNDSEPRIVSNTPKNKTQYVFSSVNSQFLANLNKINSTIPEIDRLKVPQVTENLYALKNSLGTSDLQTKQVPSWKITMLDGEIETTTTSGSLTLDNQIIPIPQIEITYTARTNVRNINKTPIPPIITSTDAANKAPISSLVFSDGDYVQVTEDNLIIMIEETGIPYSKENYDIEVFEVEPNGNYKTLKTTQKKTNVINDIIVEDDLSLDQEEIDDTYAEFFFNLNVDREINQSVLCDSIKALRSKGVNIDYEVECDEAGYSPTELSPYLEGLDADGVCDETSPEDFCD
jgi:hypothetical protein